MPFDSRPPDLSDPLDWDRLLAALDPASLLLVIDSRLGPRIARSWRAEDVLQECLLIAWRQRERLEWQGLTAFRNWLLTLVDHKIADFARRETAQKRGGDRGALRFSELGGETSVARPEPPDCPLETTTPGRLALLRERTEAMRRAWNDLPSDQRELLRLRLFERKSSAETALALGIGLSAVKHRYRIAAVAFEGRLSRELASSTSARAG